ncbi:GL15731 [Drosophila persimilis]|uniref:GL15731 n=2 Tax=Drosophila persimilis TaxID=7234 RepID=B4H913_DROPE|nr:GL15731 [Drosophila persimilis]
MRDFHARDFLALTYNAQTDRPSYHIVKEYLRSMLCTYIMPLGSPFLYKFQSLYTSFHEHGFYEHWRQMDLITRDGTSPNAEEFYEELGDQTDTDPAVSDAVGNRRKKHVVLTLDVLQGAFYLWSLGIALSSLGFVLEHGYFFWKKQTAGLTETV